MSHTVAVPTLGIVDWRGYKIHAARRLAKGGLRLHPAAWPQGPCVCTIDKCNRHQNQDPRGMSITLAPSSPFHGHHSAFCQRSSTCLRASYKETYSLDSLGSTAWRLSHPWGTAACIGRLPAVIAEQHPWCDHITAWSSVVLWTGVWGWSRFELL